MTAPDGRDLTPRLAKAQGLLLMLLTGSEGARGRAWVQDILWSDRAPEQAAASLRQTLSTIRKSLAEFRDVLQADRRVLSLDMARLSVDATGTSDFAEGLDIRDPEFDAWLAAERARVEPPAARAPSRSLPTRSSPPPRPEAVIPVTASHWSAAATVPTFPRGPPR